jgi:hypothetical protein
MKELLNQIATDTGVPADLLERAARARANAQGTDVDALVAGWAGGEAPAAAEPVPTPPAAAEPAPAAESGAGKLPEALVRRSAAARAKREGRPLDEVLVEMGLSPEGETPAAEPAAAATPEPAPAAADSGAGKLPEALVRRSAAARAKREGRPLDEVLVEMGLSPEGETSAAPVAEPAAVQTPAAPSAATKEEPAAAEPVAEEEEPQPVFAGFPRWLAASFILIPMIALLYAGLAPNGPDCGTSGQLAINPVTGEAQSCGGDASPFFSLGEAIYEVNCVACHGADGGGGVGPSFLGGAVLQTFSACTDHVQWVTLGTQNWPDATYGDTGKPAGGGGVMPGYDGNLSETEIASVALYERVAFGGQDIVEAEAACGFTEGVES